jgi:ABC-2 type transport system permease protein
MTPILAVLLKELRELLSRPGQVLTLIVGPLALMVCFGLGSEASARPPETIVVVPAGQPRPRLLEEHQRQFDEFLRVTDYTDDEALARERLRQGRVDAVVILPASPFETIAGGEQATIRVLYDQIDPIWRWVVPNFAQILANAINREIFLETVGTEQRDVSEALADVDLVLEALRLAVQAADAGDRAAAHERLAEARAAADELASALEELGGSGALLRGTVVQIGQRLAQAEALLRASEGASEGDSRPLRERLGLVDSLAQVQRLRAGLERVATVSPEVIIAPLAVETQNVARLEPDIVTFYAPAVLALIVQHIAVSMGSLALVRERLSGVFELYRVAPLSNLQLLLGKYAAYLCFTLAIAGVVLAVLLGVLRVPLLGSPWRLVLVLVLLALASVGLGLLFSLLAGSERQAVQFSMLSLLGMVFFSGFSLPLDALRFPATALAALLPATYGVQLLQDVMLQGRGGKDELVIALAIMSLALGGGCWGLLHWRTNAR